MNLAVSMCGIVYSTVAYGIYGLRDSLVGLILPIIGLFVLFALGIIGAGDIKLFAALGTIVHLDIVWIVGFSFVFAAIWGAGLVLSRGIKTIAKRTKVHFTIPIMFSTLLYAIANI